MILLDTHAWIWWASDPERLTKRARKACERSDALAVSAISVWEVAMLVAHGRLGLDRDVMRWVEQALGLPRVQLEPLTPAVSILSTRLPGEAHPDPADRIILATALEIGASIATKDRRLREYPHVATIW